MQITYVVDTSFDVDKTHLELWYKGTIYTYSHKFIYDVTNLSFSAWVQENIEACCPRADKPTKD